MRKLLLLMTVLFVAVFATSSFAGSIIAGGGATLDMYKTNDRYAVDAIPRTLLGYGIAPTAGIFGSLTPDEAFFVLQYGKAKLADTSISSSIYSGSIAGIWYICNPDNKFVSFLVLRTTIESDRSELGNLTFWNGEFGLGGSYPVSSNARLFGTATAKYGEWFSTDFAVGIKANLKILQ